jgi:hypothetical protein
MAHKQNKCMDPVLVVIVDQFFMVDSTQTSRMHAS